MRNLKINRIYKITITVLLFLCAGSFCYSLEINGPGKQMYMKQCASCHGDKGEGVNGEYEEALFGDWSLSKLTRYVIKSMPDDDPDLCVGDDAVQAAKYIFNEFYSPQARLRNSPPRIELSHLTNRQFRESVSDLFRQPVPDEPAPESGLSASYYNSKGMNKKDSLKKRRIDHKIDFDFGSGSPIEGIKAEQFSIAWEGSLRAESTGFYGLRLTTPNGARLYLNVNIKEGDKNYRDDASKESNPPLIDAWVSSGNKSRTESARVFLQGGREYPIRIDYFKYKESTGSIRFEWLPPNAVWSVPIGDQLSTRKGNQLILAKTSFPPDDRSLGYERGSDISKEWLSAVTRASLDVAEQVDSILGYISGVKSKDDPQKTEKLISVAMKVLERAYRRPLTEQEKEQSINLIFAGSESPEVAVKRVVLLAIKSPHFLYPQLSSGKTPSYQVASRLALGLWDSIPDDVLIAAASEGKLSNRDYVRSEAKRMLEDARARSKVIDFFYHWLDLDPERDLMKDDKAYPDFDHYKISDLRRSMNMFIEDVVWSKKSDYRDLLLSSHIYLNQGLSGVYGKSVEGDEMKRIDFEKTERSGLLTHPYLLSHFSYSYNSSPIHRGVFLTRHMLGRTLKPPPQAVSFENQKLDPNLSMREKITHVTKGSNCMACHEIINSLGFSLENYDGIGRWRDTENNKRVDPFTQFETRSGNLVNLRGSRSLAQFIANDSNAQKNFVQNLFEYMIKQPIQAYGENTVKDLHAHFVKSNFSCKELIVEILCLASTKGIKQEES